MGNRDALLICNTEYDDVSLSGLHPLQVDVEEFAAVLGNPELGAFNVTSLVNQEVQAVRVAIARLCKDSSKDDVKLIYYFGRGLKDENARLFLALKDTQVNLLSATGLSSQFLLEEVSNCRARSNVIILDCPFSGAILGGVIVPRDVVILACSTAYELALSQHLSGPSPFSAGLIEGLKTGDADLDGDGNVSFNELFQYARRKVEVATEGNQSPRIYDLTERPVIASTAARPIFLSYSRADSEFASILAGELRNFGHKVWMDITGITGGDDWRERIGAAINTSKLVVAILSSEALSSTWVRRELSYADEVGKPILPVFYKPPELPSWYELQFGSIQRLDLTGQVDAVNREKLLSSVKRTLQSR
jgi:hypothetical protein